MEQAVGAATPSRFYAPELDALRFGAFLLVFCRHVTNALGQAKMQVDLNAAPVRASIRAATGVLAAPPLSSKWIKVQEGVQSLDFGVCLFFFLSAFLITRLLLVEKKTTGKIAVRDFYVRRALRIWPLYFFFLVLVVVLSLFFPILHVSASRLWVAVFFVANWAAVLHGWQSIAIQPLWSVSIEEQFYLVWPNFARFGKSAIIGVSTALVLVSLATLTYLGHRGGTQVTQVWPNTLVQCIFLSAGALTACLSAPEKRDMKLPVRLPLIAGGFVCWVIAGAGFHVARTNSPGAFDLVAGYLLVLLGTFLIFSGVAGWRSTRIPGALVYLGKISYGLYVFHVAAFLLSQQIIAAMIVRVSTGHVSPYGITAISALLGLAITVVCATLSYSWLEKPFLRLKARFTVVPSRPV